MNSQIKLGKNTISDVRNVIEANFSTTGIIEKTAS